MLRLFITFYLLVLAVPAGAETRIVALGDSLTAGYGLTNTQDTFPNKLKAALATKGHTVVIENAGVSGDTSTGGKNRLDWALANKPQVVIVELGANDALRGIEPKLTEQNLDAILTELSKRKITVVLAGMRAPRNYGPEYAAEFDSIYPRLAEKHGAFLYPFFLEHVALVPELNQPDGIHPTAEGIDIIVKKILPVVQRALRRASAS